MGMWTARGAQYDKSVVTFGLVYLEDEGGWAVVTGTQADKSSVHCNGNMFVQSDYKVTPPPLWNTPDGETFLELSFSDEPSVYNKSSFPAAEMDGQIGKLMIVPVELMRYTHDSVATKFQNGSTIDNCVKDLKDGKVLAQDLGQVGYGDDQQWGTDMWQAAYFEGWFITNSANRRLYCVKEAGNISTVVVKLVALGAISPNAFSSQNAGESVELRHDARTNFNTPDKDAYSQALKKLPAP